jgi:hypothetical protein
VEHREISDEVSVNGEQSALGILAVKILLRTFMSIAPSTPKITYPTPRCSSPWQNVLEAMEDII